MHIPVPKRTSNFMHNAHVSRDIPDSIREIFFEKRHGQGHHQWLVVVVLDVSKHFNTIQEYCLGL